MTSTASDTRTRIFEAELCDNIKPLTQFALKRTGDAVLAADLVQSTLERALVFRNRFEAGTNMRAWLFTMLKRVHLNHIRKHQRETGTDAAEYIDRTMSAPATQERHMELIDLAAALTTLSTQQQEALLVVVVANNDCNYAASRCGCRVGTIKSRVSRGREGILAYFNGLHHPRRSRLEVDRMAARLRIAAFGTDDTRHAA